VLPNHIKLEACVGSLEDSVAAENHGAHQLELCGRLDIDGLTPDISLIESVLNTVNIPVKVMLRNRGGDFNYLSEDIDQMKKSLKTLLQYDVAGIVFGALDGDGNVDLPLTREICKLCGDIPVTFHKAIDYSNDIVVSTRQLIDTGVQSILTSGGMPTAKEGISTLQKMITITNGKIYIIPAGSITSGNVLALHQEVGAGFYHGKRIVE